MPKKKSGLTLLKEEIAKQEDLTMQLYQLDRKGKLNLTTEQYLRHVDCFALLNDMILEVKKKPLVDPTFLKQFKENTAFFQELTVSLLK